MTKYKLGEICEIVSGSTPKTGIAEYWGGELKWITPAEISEDSYIITDSVRKLTELGIKKTGLTPLPKGTVILSSRAPIGKVAIAGCEMYCNQGFKNLICTKKINNRYLYWFLKGNTAYLNSLGRGATFKEISKQIVSGIEINVPDMNQQMQAVENLEKVWRIIQLRKQELQKGDELIKARFVELFGDLVNPKCQWKKEKLVDACKNPDDIKCGPFGTQLSKDEYCSSGVAVWEISQINSGFATQPTHFLTDEKANQLEVYSIKSGDIAMSRKGNVGRCAVFPETMEDGIIHSDILRIRVNNDLVLPVFMMYQLHYSRAVQHQIELVSSGAIMAGINVTKLKQIEVHIPPLKLQQQFDAFVAEVDKSKVAIQAALDKSQLLFDSLMQKYFG